MDEITENSETDIFSGIPPHKRLEVWRALSKRASRLERRKLIVAHHFDAANPTVSAIADGEKFYESIKARPAISGYLASDRRVGG